MCKGIAIMSYEKSKLSELIKCSYGSEGYKEVPEWTVSHLIPAQGVGCMYGDTKALKTFGTLDIACCITTGEQWAGKHVAEGNVIYIAAEGGNDISKRVKACELHNKFDVGSKLLIVKSPLSPVDHDEFEWLLSAAKEHEELTGLQTKLIVFDTLSQCAKNLEENSAKDMSEFIRACNKLSEKLHTPVLFVHHTGKNGSFRGSSVIECNTDFIFKMKRSNEDLSSILSVCKQKDYEVISPINIQLAVQDLDFTYEDGESVSSLVVTHTSCASDHQVKAKPKKSQKELSAQKLLDRAIAKIPAVILAVDDLVDDSDFDSRMQKKRALEVLSKYPNITLSADHSHVTVTPHTKGMGVTVT